MPNRQKLNLAVVGAGLIGQRHIERVKEHPLAKLVAIADPCSAADLALKHHVPYFSSLESLLAELLPLPDGIILATPNHLHFEQAVQCIKAKIPILLEKPLTATLDEGLKLCKLVDQTGAKVLVGHHRAHSPIMHKAKEIIASGKLGELVAVMGSAMFYKPTDYFKVGPWRSRLGGGPILINMIHEVHNLRMLCGEIRAIQAFASNKQRSFEVEDTVAINFQFANGVLGTFMLSDTAASSKSWEQTSQEDKNYPHDAQENCYVVAGTRGSLSIPTMNLTYYPPESEPSWWRPFAHGQEEMVREDPLRGQLDHFLRLISHDIPPRVSVHDALANLRVTEAIALAAQQTQTVYLNDIP
ncbi:MAG: Gfo/Idh/MocA family oxidoreductase [Deinococcales bacterium]